MEGEREGEEKDDKKNKIRAHILYTSQCRMLYESAMVDFIYSTRCTSERVCVREGRTETEGQREAETKAETETVTETEAESQTASIHTRTRFLRDKQIAFVQGKSSLQNAFSQCSCPRMRRSEREIASMR